MDRFWNTLHDGELIYVNDDLTKWIGYNGAEARFHKHHLIKTLGLLGYVSGTDYLSLTNDEYADFLAKIVCEYSHTKLYPIV
jgi:hypothetical protein